MTRGIIATQSGIDVSASQDSQRILDSRWKYLEIEREVLITIPALNQTSGAQVVYEHNLGYLPAFEIYDNVLNAYIDGSDSTGAGLVSDTTKIYFNGFYNDDGWSDHQALLRIYKLDITEEFEAPISKTFPAKPGSKTRQGIKVSQTNANFREQELSRFAMSTTGKTLAIQRTGIATANSGTSFIMTIKHGLGYPPTYLVTYADFYKKWVSAINPDFIPVKSRADGENLIISGAQSALIGTMGYIIFKELGDFAI